MPGIWRSRSSAGHRLGCGCIAVAVLFVLVAAGLVVAASTGAQAAPSPGPSVPHTAPTSAPSKDSGTSWIAELLTGWIHDFFAGVALSALNGVLGMLANSLLATPQFDQLPVMGQLWGSSRNIVLAAYAVVTTIAGVVVVTYQTLQTRASVKEILPRLVVGFVAANLSLFFAGKAIEFANALSRSFLGGQTGMHEASRVFADTLLGNPSGDDEFKPYGDLYVVFTVLALVVMIIAVLLTYVVRIALTVILLVSAPLMLMCHALPQTESIAFWWWKAFGAVLAVQVAQSLTFIATLKIFYLPGGITLF